MKLSRAIAVVLLLHVVAVGGVLAFGLIKPPPKPGAAETARPAVPVVVEAPSARAPAVLASKPSPRSPPAGPRATTVAVQEVPPAAAAAPRAAAPAQDDALRLIEGASLPPASAAKPGRAEEGGGRTYVVARGDTPFSIAKRHGVSEAALLRANSIDEPRKLQVGQRLVIPSR